MSKYNLIVVIFLFASCKSFRETSKRTEKIFSERLNEAQQQVWLQVEAIEKGKEFKNPLTMNVDGSVQYARKDNWCVGFFPGSLWYMYQLTKDGKWLNIAKKYTKEIEYIQFITDNHDVGFMATCSFGNALKITQEPIYRDLTIQSAKSLITRFRRNIGVIQSWDTDKGWMSQRNWSCPVIIDNMMNLELLFDATRLSGDSLYHKIAVTHADRTLQEHFREDGSCYHVVDYDLNTGKVRSRETAQGYANESAWARGQAWAVYGFTVCYRYTRDPKYLSQALKTLNFILNHPNLPTDKIPYWDFNAPKIPDEPRDVSTASVLVSTLYELANYDEKHRRKYLKVADTMLYSLCQSEYFAKIGTNANFILKHSVGSIPHNSQVDVPLNYADYYFLEALYRRKNLNTIEK